MYLEQMYAHNYIQWCKNEGHLLWVEVFWKNLYDQLYTQIAYVKKQSYRMSECCHILIVL